MSVVTPSLPHTEGVVCCLQLPVVVAGGVSLNEIRDNDIGWSGEETRQVEDTCGPAGGCGTCLGKLSKNELTRNNRLRAAAASLRGPPLTSLFVSSLAQIMASIVCFFTAT
ncbi:unnamed protein product [Danaus chrysippus]|uniref:(African queen) hypothetical protein n=1 Tax=Danaus chrysippus TaxID=151541 RepID=A0A8J2QE24_9NEOP|nr:unnamed protein product [Danaus chrysippus]